jgi:hypothetical protein
MQMRHAKRLGASVAVVVALMACAIVAHAQISLLLDPSARSGGLGGASSAVTWGGAPNVWANPALVTAAPGFTIQVSEQHLVPGILEARFDVTRFSATLAGLSWSSAGRPLGSQVLDIGMTGFDVGVAERVAGDAFGVSAAGVADVVAAATGHRFRLSSWGDVAWARQWNQIRAIEFVGESATRDDGLLVRLTPIDSRRKSQTPVGGVRVELAYGHSRLDEGGAVAQEMLPFVPADEFPLPRARRDGGAMHLSWYGPERGAEPGAALADVFRGGLGPLVETTIAYDRENVEEGAGYHYLVDHYGIEATWLRVLATRFGYVSDREGLITKPAWGLGAILPVSRYGDIRYDFASIPQSYPRRVYRHEVSLRLDPVTRWFGLQPSNEAR